MLSSRCRFRSICVNLLFSGLAKGPRAATAANARHVPEVCAAPGEGGAVQEDEGRRGEVWGSRRRRGVPPEEARGAEGQDGQLGNASDSPDKPKTKSTPTEVFVSDQ